MFAEKLEKTQLSIVEKQNLADKEKAELRRQMYERIAAGNALSESEDKAFHQWKQR
jgi:hypothetical protein